MPNRTKIEWCDFTMNPVKGLCPVACEYCYARKMYHRFHWDPEIRFVPSVGDELKKMPDGSRVFWGSTMELFGKWIKPEWWKAIMNAVQVYDNLTHIFLTKCPQNLPKEWPANCYVGVSVTTQEQANTAFAYLPDIKAKVKFLSFEPLLADVSRYLYFEQLIKSVQWSIIGARTQPLRLPEISWVNAIVWAADKARIPVFIKEPLATYYIHRQEYPSV